MWLPPLKRLLTRLLVRSKAVCDSKGLAMTSLLFALVGFSYNVWRLELSESNTTVRTACFQMILELAKLEQIIYANVYDHDLEEGSPRKAWVKVGVIVELSHFTSNDIQASAQHLHTVWSENSKHLSQKHSVNAVIKQMDNVREDIQAIIQTLR